MDFIKKTIEIINAKNTPSYLIYGFIFIKALDVLTTYYALRFLEGYSESKPLTGYLIQNFGIFWGLIISVPIELAILYLIYIFLKSLPQKLLRIRDENTISLLNALWIMFPLAFIYEHLIAEVSNISKLFASF